VNAAQVWFISGVGRLGIIDGCRSFTRFLANPPIGQAQLPRTGLKPANLCLFLGRVEVPGFGEDLDDAIGKAIEEAAHGIGAFTRILSIWSARRAGELSSVGLTTDYMVAIAAV
jgi:hypothetical protein